MSARTAIAAGVAAAALIAAGAIGWIVRGWRADAAEADMLAQHALVMQSYAGAACQAGQAARSEEQRRIAALEEAEHETQRQVAAVIADERRAADQRVQRTVDDYTARYRDMAERASAADEREAASAAIGMFAELLGRTDDLAGVYAAQADRARVAAMACERLYDALRQ